MNKNEIIDAIIRTLNGVSISGFENYQKMLGVLNALEQLKEAKEDVDLPKSE